MANISVEREILDQIHSLSEKDQKRVLEFARSLVRNELKGVAGKKLLRFAGTIGMEDLRKMAKAIDEDCERVNPSEWQISSRYQHCYCSLRARRIRSEAS